jgi:N-acetylglucosaminyldiphosphoundecaprenol N-acetyl-beta-D-mannosaminyltransferase
MAKLNVLGVGVSAINMESALETIVGWIQRGERHYVCALNVHSVIESRSDSELRRIHNRAGLATPDGMPLVWLLKQAGYVDSGRVCGPDLMLALVQRGCEYGLRHFLYGSTPNTLARLERNLTARFPEAEIVGSLAPPFRPLTEAEDREVVATINESGAQVVWVGLGAPKQERWMAQHRAALEPNVMVGVGAAFDFHAGVVKQAPKAVQQAGFEWAFRLAMEPRRLWKRYLTTNPRFVAEIAAQKAGLRRFELDG